MYALCSLNESTVKRQTRYVDLRILKSVVRPQDWMLILDVESVLFHVPIHPNHHKFFSSPLTLPRPNTVAPVSPLSSSRRVLQFNPTVRVDEMRLQRAYTSTLAPDFDPGVRLLQGDRRPFTVKSYDQK